MSEPTPGLSRARITDGAILIAIVGIVLWAVLAPSRSRVDGLVGEPAPKFKLKTVSGEVTGPPDHLGKVVLLDFWATWCNPCFRQMPIIQEVLAERSDLVVLPINVDDAVPNRKHAIEQFLERAGLEVDSLLDDGAVQAMYRVDTLPSLILIDPSGAVAYASSGVHSAEQLRERVDAIAVEAR